MHPFILCCRQNQQAGFLISVSDLSRMPKRSNLMVGQSPRTEFRLIYTFDHFQVGINDHVESTSYLSESNISDDIIFFSTIIGCFSF